MFVKNIIKKLVNNNTYIDSNCKIGKYTYIGKRGGGLLKL